MNLTFTSIVRAGDGSWAFTWAAVMGATQYRVTLQNQLLAIVTAATYNYALPDTGPIPPAIEVTANNDYSLSELNPGRLSIQWYGLTDAIANEDIQYYLVEQNVGGNWVEVAHVAEKGTWVYSVTTPNQPDGVTAIYRVSAVGSVGQVSDYINYQVFVVRPPTPPVVTVGFNNATTQITVDN